MKLFVMGNCFTAYKGWPETVASYSNRELVKLAEFGSSNEMQMKRVQECFLDGKITNNDLLIWQIIIPTQLTSRIKEFHQPFSNINFKHYVETNKNKFDNEPRIDLLSQSPFRHFIDNPNFFDEKQQLQDLLFMFYMINLSGAKLLITRSKYNDINIEDWQVFKNQLEDKKNISFLDETLLEWCREEKLRFFSDGEHPVKGSRIRFAKEVIIPKLNDLGWF